jgi:hypothetical protein
MDVFCHGRNKQTNNEQKLHRLPKLVLTVETHDINVCAYNEQRWRKDSPVNQLYIQLSI